MKIRIIDEYPCINGESLHAGRTAYLVRCGGCNLRCPYCDTPESWEGGVLHATDDIAARVIDSGMDHLLLTGGEPLLQPDAAAALTEMVLAAGVEVVVETNGTLPIATLPERAVRVLDLKPPSAAPSEVFHLANLEHMGPQDQLKVVLSSREDYEWTLAWLDEHSPPIPAHHVLFSPADPELRPATLAEWIQQDRIPHRLHLQIHKVIWGERSRI
jgi:7-carboxy-7-deazaguanine synthase